MNFERDAIDEIIDDYNKTMSRITEKAISNSNRAYGGVIRSEKGKLVELICNRLITLAWSRINPKGFEFNIARKEFRIPINQHYIEKIKEKAIKEYIKKNISDFYYNYLPDIVAFINGKPSLVVECKAYTENAMFKRILVDFTLLKSVENDIKSVLFQLESQLGGDYSKLNDITYGSPSTHTLLSYFDVDLYIITLLKGERKVDQPIHEEEFFKPLTRASLEKAILTFSNIFYDIIKAGDLG
jgi:hypothetical protein